MVAMSFYVAVVTVSIVIALLTSFMVLHLGEILDYIRLVEPGPTIVLMTASIIPIIYLTEYVGQKHRGY